MSELERYCDLTAADLAALREPTTAHHSTRRSLRGEGWLNDHDQLTPQGQAILDQAEHYLAHGPVPALLPMAQSPAWQTARRAGLDSTTAKLLCYLARSPSTTYRFLYRVFGDRPCREAFDRGLATGALHRGASWQLTLAGLDTVRAWQS
ncbi:MAG: hypothetical protein KKA73_18395 [Chloroflexi bacterium]|nr:hypothetical protein [Chloroflexota bacterium]MBU1749658.1 hypothetical protein [Chloroflexota bacterium]